MFVRANWKKKFILWAENFFVVQKNTLKLLYSGYVKWKWISGTFILLKIHINAGWICSCFLEFRFVVLYLISKLYLICNAIGYAFSVDLTEDFYWVLCNFNLLQDGSCNGLQHYAALGRDKVILPLFAIFFRDFYVLLLSEVGSRLEESKSVGFVTFYSFSSEKTPDRDWYLYNKLTTFVSRIT